MNGLLLLAGLLGLWLGTELTIRGAVVISKRLGISEFIVGVAILAIGSDLPELAIAIDGAVINLHAGETSDVIVGTALGSALGQIGFVLGVAGIIGYLTLPKRIIYQHGGVLLGSLILLALVGFDGAVTRTEGISLLTVYFIYFVFLLADSRGSAKPDDGTGMSLIVAWTFLIVGLLVVFGSAELTVDAVIRVATALDIEQSLIALLVIGLGSSLPELSISIAAVLKRRARMSVGNLIGSNIFDTLIPIGVAATIYPLGFERGMLTRELPYLFALSLLVLYFFRRKKGLQTWEAVVVLALYCAYALVKIVNA